MKLRFEWLLWTLPLLAVTVSAEDAAKPDAPVAGVREVEAGDLKLSVPGIWKQQQPSNNLRLAQFAISPVEGDTEPSELVVSPPIGGTREANIARWIDQFEREGRELVMSQGKCPQGEYVLVQLSGTYRRPNGPPILRKTVPTPGYRMHGVMLSVTKDGKSGGNYFLKLTGPAKTVIANDDALRASFGADKSKEEKYELP
jgi:gluconolactonase